MPPPNDPKSTNHEGKTKFFSIGWFFRKNKSSGRSAKETANHSTMPSSKSCEVTLESMDRYPKYLFRKLLPGKSSSSQNHLSQRTLPLRSSFSCNDVHSLCPLNQSASTGIKNALGVVKHPYQSLYSLCKSHSVLTNLETERTLFIKSQESGTHSKREIWCKLCLVMVPANSMYTLKDCNCVFCIACLYQYLNINIKEGKVPVTCPDAECSVPGKILVSEIKEIAGNDALILFERYKLNLDIELDPSKVWCPAPGCETVCTFQPSTNPNVGAPAYCFTCKLKFCSLCKLRWHGKTSCEDAKRALNDDSDLSTSDEESWIKQCPNCRIPIEKDEGCAQMMCYRCKHVFCWHCLASLDEEN